MEFFLNEVVLTPEQEIDLFKIRFKVKEKELFEIIDRGYKKYGIIDYDTILPYQKEILVDFVFNGDFDRAGQDFVIP